MRCTAPGLDIIRDFESLRLEAYLCPSMVWTIGWGHTQGVKKGDTCTEEQADAWLAGDVQWAESCINSHVSAPLTQNQFDALVSFVFNVGCAAFEESTLLKHLNGKDYEGAARQLLRWDKSKGKKLAGLTRRRKAEMELFA